MVVEFSLEVEILGLTEDDVPSQINCVGLYIVIEHGSLQFGSNLEASFNSYAEQNVRNGEQDGKFNQ